MNLTRVSNLRHEKVYVSYQEKSSLLKKYEKEFFTPQGAGNVLMKFGIEAMHLLLLACSRR
jgi:hypothetical protein